MGGILAGRQQTWQRHKNSTPLKHVCIIRLSNYYIIYVSFIHSFEFDTFS